MPSRPNRHRQAKVTIAYLSTGKIDGPFHDSVYALREYDQYNQDYLSPHAGGGRIRLQSSPGVAEARNQVVDIFMRHKTQGGLYHKSDWLFWLDADATFDPDILERLMAVANETDVPILGALAFGGANAERMFPTIYGMERLEDGSLYIPKIYDYPRDKLVKVAGTGCHCVLIHRSVFHVMFKLFATMPDGTPNAHPWYSDGHVDAQGQVIGEDISFCLRAAAAGFPTHVHTGIKTGHIKTAILDEALWDFKVQRDGLPTNDPPPGRIEKPVLELVLP